MTMALEAYEQLPVKPTHIFLQAGVGSLAGSVQGFFADIYGSSCPLTFIVEPKGADCLYQTAAANDGSLHSVTGRLETIMAGLWRAKQYCLGNTWKFERWFYQLS